MKCQKSTSLNERIDFLDLTISIIQSLKSLGHFNIPKLINPKAKKYLSLKCIVHTDCLVMIKSCFDFQKVAS